MLIWFTGNAVANILSGIIAHGVGEITTSNIAAWKLLFLILGAITTFWGIVLVFLLPSSPSEARFLTPDERTLCLQRTIANKTGILEKSEFKIHQMVAGLLDPQAWLLFFAMFTVSVANGGISAVRVPRREIWVGGFQANIGVVWKHPCRCFRIQSPHSGSHANAIWRYPARRHDPILYPSGIYENSAYHYYGFYDYRLTCWYSNGICSTFRAKVVTPGRILDHNYLCCYYPTAAQPHHIERGRIYKEINCVGHAFRCILRGEYCRTAVLFHGSGSEVLCKLCSPAAQDVFFLTDVM